MERHGWILSCQPAGQAISMNAKELGNLGILAPALGQGPDPLSDLDAVWKETERSFFDRVIDVYIKELEKNWSWTVSLRYAMHKLERP